MASTPFNRRDFGFALASSAATVALTSATSADDTKLKTSPDDKQPPQAAEIPEPVYLLGAVLRHYPDKRLDESAITGILRDIAGDLARGKVLSNFPLKNSDEPSYVFQAWRSD